MSELLDKFGLLSWTQVRVPTNIVSTICDDRGEEPTYNGVDMTTLMTGDKNVGDVISLLWFKRQLPKYATRFIEMCIMLCADHGPCVSGLLLSLSVFDGLRLPFHDHAIAKSRWTSLQIYVAQMDISHLNEVGLSSRLHDLSLAADIHGSELNCSKIH